VAEFPDNLAQCTGFQWDAGNADKNWQLHRVTRAEAEQVFFNRPILVVADPKHSQFEARLAALGQTNEGRRLLIVFTIREDLIRVISARTRAEKNGVSMPKRKPKSKKALPRFADEDQERKFWAEHDSTEIFDWSKAVQPSFPELKPSTTAISIRLPISMLEELKSLANQQDVPYQSLMKLYLAERIKKERLRKAG
jgi:uncharacterized DUF497 family protein/predicted DNA binding CopG/RHH family protein